MQSSKGGWWCPLSQGLKLECPVAAKWLGLQYLPRCKQWVGCLFNLAVMKDSQRLASLGSSGLRTVVGREGLS